MDLNPYVKAVCKTVPKDIRENVLGYDRIKMWMQEFYGESTRFYHTARHILECVQMANEVTFENPSEAYMALLLHDAVYDVSVLPDRENVIASAKRADSELQFFNSKIDKNILYGNILATSHVDKPVTPDEKLIADIDMSILAASPVRYFEYVEDIMKEYTLVYTLKQYVGGRIQFLTNTILKAQGNDLFYVMKDNNKAALRNMQEELHHLTR